MQVYHTSEPARPPRHRARRLLGPLPLRVYLVLKYLRAALPPGQPVSLSNAALAQAVGYGSEGEVSQVMRWLSGALPLSGRWAHRYLDAPQQLRYLVRERRPDGGYITTLLATPTPLALAEHDPVDDPQPSRSSGESAVFAHDPLEQQCFTAPGCDEHEFQRDHAIESKFNQTQEEESARTRESSIEASALYQRLISEPSMSRSLARRLAAAPLGTLAEFERDIQIAASIPSVATPLYFTVARWRDGQRVRAQEMCHAHAPQATRPAASASSKHAHRRRAERSGAGGRAASGGPAQRPATDYDAFLAELCAANPGL